MIAEKKYSITPHIFIIPWKEKKSQEKGGERTDMKTGKWAEEKMSTYKIPSYWRGAITKNRRLTTQAVICLFRKSWGVCPTDRHTHDRNFLHFHKGDLTRERLAVSEKIFSLWEEQSKYCPFNEEEKYMKIEQLVQEKKRDLFS